MSKKLNVTVLMDGACVPADDPQFERVPEETTTEYSVMFALRELGHRVTAVGVETGVAQVVQRMESLKADLVFNLTEVFRDNRTLDKGIANLLELMGIPFTGAGVVGLLLCRDKNLSKQLLNFHRIHVPGFVGIPPGRRVAIPKSLRYPLVVKPAWEDGSVGISNGSLVGSREALLERAAMIHERLHQPAIAEEYVDGRELYVAVLGNQRLDVLPPRELFFDRRADGGPVLATYRVKWDHAYREKWGIRFGDAELDARTLAGVKRVCRRVFRSLQLHDYARVDLRVTPEGRIVVLEVNPNPDIAYGEEVAEAAERADISYESLIDRIVRLALKRYGRA